MKSIIKNSILMGCGILILGINLLAYSRSAVDQLDKDQDQNIEFHKATPVQNPILSRAISSILVAESDLAFWQPPDFIIRNQKAMGYDEKSFSVPEELKNDVQFWIDIYTKYSTRQGVFHRIGKTDEILGEIDLSDVFANQKWSAIRKEKESELIVRLQKKIIARKWGIKNINEIRLQMGLKDRMLEAIKNSGLYLPMIEKIFQEEKLPLELSRIVFVESSFNIRAGSKVGASGLWQIMPILGKKFNYITDTYDKRNHGYYSTKLAAKILKENFQILKSWPLAVTGYNHGVGSLKKIVEKYKSRDIGFLADNVKTRKSFGFASRNFYTTFLAALHVEKNANLYFPEPILRRQAMNQKDFYLKKSIKFEKLLALFNDNMNDLKLYNSHIYSQFLRKNSIIPAKTLISLPAASSNSLAELVEFN